jgi:hypothetical protein
LWFAVSEFPGYLLGMKILKIIVLSALFSSCASSPLKTNGFSGLPGYSDSTEPSLQAKLPAQGAAGLKALHSANGIKRTVLVNRDGVLTYPIGNLKLQEVLTETKLVSVRDKNFGDLLSQNFKYSRLLSHEFGITYAAKLNLPSDLLNQTLALDPREDGYRFAEKWLYHERGTRSLLDLTSGEGKKFAEESLETFYVAVSELSQKRAPGILIFSPVVAVNDLKDDRVRELTERFCDVLRIRYPSSGKLPPSERENLTAAYHKPVYFMDVPATDSSKAAFALIANPKVVGFEWNQESAAANPEFTQAISRQVFKLAHYFDQNGVPSNF